MTDPATDPVDAALALWDLKGATTTFIAGRENRVYRVTSQGQDLALRFKRPGYRTDAELTSELQWMAAIHAAGLSVPRPIPSRSGPLRSGALLQRVKEQRFDMLGWLGGEPMTAKASPETFRRLGQEIARLHMACDAWTPPPEFTRCFWNVQGLLGEAPVWGRFWDNPSLEAETRTLLHAFRHKATAELTRIEGALDFGLIHADLVGDNVLLHEDRVTFIDFDDGGFGFRLFELATVLLKHHQAPNFSDIIDALLAGYRSLRPIDARHLDLFLALRAVTYVGWIISRWNEPGAEARAGRFTQAARALCQAYLNARQ